MNELEVLEYCRDNKIAVVVNNHEEYDYIIEMIASNCFSDRDVRNWTSYTGGISAIRFSPDTWSDRTWDVGYDTTRYCRSYYEEKGLTVINYDEFKALMDSQKVIKKTYKTELELIMAYTSNSDAIQTCSQVEWDCLARMLDRNGFHWLGGDFVSNERDRHYGESSERLVHLYNKNDGEYFVTISSIKTSVKRRLVVTKFEDFYGQLE